MANMTVIAQENWANFTSGDFIGASVNSYTTVMGVWFYIIVMLTTMTMIQLKLKNFGTTAIMGILISAAVIPWMPEFTYHLILVMLALGVAGIMYKLFR